MKPFITSLLVIALLLIPSCGNNKDSNEPQAIDRDSSEIVTEASPELFPPETEGLDLYEDERSEDERSKEWEESLKVYFFTTTDNVNLRKSPNTESARITTIPKDTTVCVTDLLDHEWFLVSYDGQTGFMKADFLTEAAVQMLTPLKYDYAGDFHEGMAAVGVGGWTPGVEIGEFYSGKYGYIDQTGREVVSPDKYHEARDFAEGLAAVSVGGWVDDYRYEGKWGFIDKAGKEVIPLKYDYVGNFSEGLAVFRIGDDSKGKYGFLDKSGKEVIPPIYSYAESFSEGLAVVHTGGYYGGQWGYVDPTGREAIPLHYDRTAGFSDGRAAVLKMTKGTNPDDDQWGFIDKEGGQIAPYQYHYVEAFKEGMALVYDDSQRDQTSYLSHGKYGFVDKTGKELTPPDYDGAESFSEGLALVRYGGWESNGEGGMGPFRFAGKFGFIDNTGKIIVPFGKYSYMAGFSDGMAAVGIGDWRETGWESYAFLILEHHLNGKFGFIDKYGREVVAPKYDEVGKFAGGVAAVSIGDQDGWFTDRRWGFIDRAGKEIVPLVFQFSPYGYKPGVSEGMAAVELNGKWGYIAFGGQKLPESPAEPIQADGNIFADVNWPIPVEAYSPELKVFPLTDAFYFGSYRLDGDVVFVNEQLEPVELPFPVYSYHVLYSESNYIYSKYETAAFVLLTDSGDVLMLADGTFPLHDDGLFYAPDYTWGDNIHYNALGGSMVTRRAEDPEDPDGINSAVYYGLYDLGEKRELLPEVYSSFDEFGGLYFAAKDGFGYMYSDKGDLLYEFGRIDDQSGWPEVNWYRDYRPGALDQWWSIRESYREEALAAPFNEYTLYGPNGEVILELEPFTDYSTPFRYLSELNGFILLWLSDPNCDELFEAMPPSLLTAVYAHDGTLLVDAPYGVIDTPGPGGGIFVYLNENRCILLSPDGSSVPVAAAPSVRRIFYAY